nr:hypothetical protein StreXyl84_36500 [Streptomyces sp. Xyl84]
MQHTGQAGDREDGVFEHPLAQRHDGGPGARPPGGTGGRLTVRTRPVTVRARRVRTYSRASRARIGVVGACRLRSGHLKALPVSRPLFRPRPTTGDVPDS